MTRSKLDPWPVIVACLFELDSHAIPNIIDKSGMVVDWTLNEKQDYSHNYRKRAYRPRISGEYQGLDRDSQLRVAYVVTNELARGGRAEQLHADLLRIGWSIDGDTLVPTNESVRETFFPPGTQHDAYVKIREIMRRATDSICVIDPYLDESIFRLLGEVPAKPKIKLLTYNHQGDFTQEATKFQRQYPHLQLETRLSRDFHDRFIVVDDQECWHVGCSIKDAGDRTFMLSRIEDGRNVKALLDSFDAAWSAARQPVQR